MIKQIGKALSRAWNTWCEQSGKHLMIAYGISPNETDREGVSTMRREPNSEGKD